MRVLVFTTQFYKLGGIERLAVELAVDLNRAGVHADLLSMYSSALPGVLTARDSLIAEGIPAVAFLELGVNPSAVRMIVAVRRLRSILLAGRYDIIETSSASPTLIAAWACIGLRTRHIAGLHDVYSREQYRGRKHAIWRAAIRGRRGTRFYAISTIARQAWIQYSNTNSSRTRVIHNGIGEEWFQTRPDCEGLKQELGIPIDDRLLLFVGRLMKRKGIDTLLEAAGPHLNTWSAHLIFVGEADMPSEWQDASEGSLLTEMHERIREQGWSSRVHFLGRRSDVPRIMASSNMLVHPARLEAFGLVLAEGIATGIPVVASNVQGIPEVLKNSQSLLVPPECPQMLREAIEQVLSRTTLEATGVKAAGLARAEYFRTRRRTTEMVRYFEDALAARS